MHMKLLSSTGAMLASAFGAVVLLFLSGLTNAVLAQSSFNQGSDNLAFAVGSVGKGAETFGTLVSLGTTIAVSLAFLFFFWNLAKFIRAADPESKEAAQGKMVWSLVAIIVIVSLWGIIAFVRGVLGIDAGLDEVNDVPVPGTVLNQSTLQ